MQDLVAICFACALNCDGSFQFGLMHFPQKLAMFQPKAGHGQIQRLTNALFFPSISWNLYSKIIALLKKYLELLKIPNKQLRNSATT